LAASASLHATSRDCDLMLMGRRINHAVHFVLA
jgi:hypothetical protein